jgi:uncharacterized membrane protein (DUF373 family)
MATHAIAVAADQHPRPGGLAHSGVATPPLHRPGVRVVRPYMATQGGRATGAQEQRASLAHRFGQVEHLLYAAVAVALVFTGAAIFGWALIQFVHHLDQDRGFETAVLALLDSLLLVFIVTELLHTIRTIIAENVLKAEPFLIVGIVAALRRIIVITAQAADDIGDDDFRDLMLELGILIGAALALGFTIFLLRHTERSEPTPDHEVGNPSDAI